MHIHKLEQNIKQHILNNSESFYSNVALHGSSTLSKINKWIFKMYLNTFVFKKRTCLIAIWHTIHVPLCSISVTCPNQSASPHQTMMHFCKSNFTTMHGQHNRINSPLYFFSVSHNVPMMLMVHMLKHMHRSASEDPKMSWVPMQPKSHHFLQTLIFLLHLLDNLIHSHISFRHLEEHLN